MPAGSVPPRVYPIGTFTAGKPDVGENTWLLSPAGVFKSPIRRRGLLQVGYTNASSFNWSIAFITAARNCSRYAFSAAHADESGPFSGPFSAFSKRNWTLG